MLQNRIWIALTAVLLVAGVGCSKSPQTVKASSEKKEWNWDAYPLLPKMRLATLSCQLQPQSMLSIPSPVAGRIRLYVNQPQTNLPQGALIAEFEPEVFRSEGEALEEARLKLEERERFQRELDVPRQQVQLSRQMDEAQRQLAMLNLISTNQELAKYAFYSPQAASSLRPEAADRARLELDILKRTYEYVQQTNLAFMGVDLQALRSDWLRRKVDFDRRLSQSRIEMPFAGQLTLSIPVSEGVQEYLVNTGQELGIVRDLSAVRARVPVANAAWTAMQPDKIEAIVRLPTGEELKAKYSFQKIERQQQREESVYYFKFPAENAKSASRLLGTDVACELWVNLDQSARVVPKLTLLMEKPEAFQGKSWARGVADAWPDAQLIAEGQSDVAILVPHNAPPVAKTL
ncbi:MAG TPA: hypothetical protein VEH27_17175 [Methylomirabilota bacterium]|nr:hypothetical protein [Methylomirabilota bacterium]